MKHHNINTKHAASSTPGLGYAGLVDTRAGLVFAAASVLGPYLLATILLVFGTQ